MVPRYFEQILSEEKDSAIRKNAHTVIKYFNKVYLMVTAACKMLNHAHFGQPREVMGLLQGIKDVTQDHTSK